MKMTKMQQDALAEAAPFLPSMVRNAMVDAGRMTWEQATEKAQFASTLNDGRKFLIRWAIYFDSGTKPTEGWDITPVEIMNQYRHENAIWLIDGYMSGHPAIKQENRFENAKREVVAVLKSTIGNIEQITFASFTERKRSVFKSTKKVDDALLFEQALRELSESSSMLECNCGSECDGTCTKMCIETLIVRLTERLQSDV